MSVAFRSVALGPLKSLSGNAPRGARIGVVGRAGSGVHELLQLAGGVVEPLHGSVVAAGSRSYVGLGATFDIRKTVAEVVALDHALAMWDTVERARVLMKLNEARTTVLVASYQLEFLERWCDEVWWLADGELRAKGDPRTVLDAVRRDDADVIRQLASDVRITPTFRRGDGRAEIVAIEMLTVEGQPSSVWQSGERVRVRATVRFLDAVASPVLGMMIRTQLGSEVYGTNTELECVALGAQAAGDALTVEFAFPCELCANAYTLTVASHDPDGTAHDWLDDAVAFTVADHRYTAGVANLRASVAVVGRG
jgi:hypothetical protein